MSNVEDIQENSIVIRKDYMHICDMKLSDAMLLYLFEQDHICRIKHQELGYDDPTSWLNSHSILSRRLYGLFTPEEISQSVSLLEQKGFIKTKPYDDYEIDCFYYVSFKKSALNAALETDNVYEEYEFTSAITSKKQTKVIPLDQQYKIEHSRVLYNLKRAQDAMQESTLTLEQWVETLNHFNWKCAYCQGKYAVLEHFIPIALGGGTTYNNCVPSCQSCNVIKGPYHPAALSGVAQSQLGRAVKKVQRYLESLVVR